jgi:protein-L-isoaspartate(D-aspartate) O-methyltransferase
MKSMNDFENARKKMVEKQIASRGVKDPRVLEAVRKVPREEFIDPHLREFAYEDNPLPIAEDQTISQPYIVALMAETLELASDDRVLEIGTGSGYAAAILAELARHVYTIERFQKLAEISRERMARLGYDNVTVVHGDGTRGLASEAPFDAIVVAAGGPQVPESLRRQLKIGGRLLIPVGEMETQRLVLVKRVGPEDYEESSLGRVRFVPLLGHEGWPTPAESSEQAASLPSLIRDEMEPFNSIEDVNLDAWLERVGEARVVMMGEATHGTSEFYKMRARLTRELIEKKGFSMVCVEADWPDAREIDNFVKGVEPTSKSWTAFSRFPTWMWRNQEVKDFADWLKNHNVGVEQPVGFFGLDLYSLSTSLSKVLEFLQKEYPKVATIAQHRYACLTPWQSDPSAYGHAVLTGDYERCEPQVVENLLKDLRQTLNRTDMDFLDAEQNARLVSNAERYYRIMYYGGAASWNLRDTHMYQTLGMLLNRIPDSKAVVWEHNSHVGDARATQMASRGEHNLGQLARQALQDEVYLIGFGTHQGTVAAASNWGGKLELKSIKPSHQESYERLFHDVGEPRFMLGLRDASDKLKEALKEPRLERAIGVIYRPETELASHYFHAILPSQFDEYIWFDETQPVEPLDTSKQSGAPHTYPFAL